MIRGIIASGFGFDVAGVEFVVTRGFGHDYPQASRFLIARGIGFNPGSTEYIPTLGFDIHVLSSIRFLIARGIGFNPGSVGYIPELGFNPGPFVVRTIQDFDGFFQPPRRYQVGYTPVYQIDPFKGIESRTKTKLSSTVSSIDLFPSKEITIITNEPVRPVVYLSTPTPVDDNVYIVYVDSSGDQIILQAVDTLGNTYLVIYEA